MFGLLPQQVRDYDLEVVAPNEAVLELGQVARCMVATDGMVGAGDGVLESGSPGDCSTRPPPHTDPSMHD